MPTPTPRKPFVRRASFAVSLVLSTTLVLSATSCAQVLGINKDYKKGVTVPKAWNCFPEFYDEIGRGTDPSKAICDCECAAYDPDCDETEAEVRNHSEDDGATINDDGKPDDPNCRSCDPDEATCSSASP